MQSFLLPCSDWLFSNEPRLRARSSMAMLAVLLMVASAGVLLWVGHTGHGNLQAIQWWCVISVTGLVIMAISVRAGWTAHWDDPAMALPQILWAVTACAVAYLIVGEAKAVIPGALAVSLLFAALNLKVRQILIVSAYTLVVLMGAVMMDLQNPGAPSLELEIAYAAAMVVMVMGCIFLSLRLHLLRRRLHIQRQELQAALAANRELASRDPLTGLLNRRHMRERLALEQRRCLRGTHTMLLAQMDIDHFKVINDTYGHGMGDTALIAFADAVRNNIRSSDVLSRWGGEEFVLLLSDTHLEGARLSLERVRMAVQAATVHDDLPELKMTVSIGLSSHVPGETLEATLSRADAALYAAKRAGRNQVAVIEPPAEPCTAAAPTSLIPELDKT